MCNLPHVSRFHADWCNEMDRLIEEKSMSTEDGYTPTTEEVRGEYSELSYVTSYWHRRGHDDGARRAAFDRWLAAHDRDVREEALKTAVTLAANIPRIVAAHDSIREEPERYSPADDLP